MRASMLSLWVGLAAAGVGSPAWAQTPAAAMSAATPAPATKPVAGDDALSPSTLPKSRQGVKEEGTNRVDELSPDEARRLERIRAKAAANKPQPPKPQPPESQPPEARPPASQPVKEATRPPAASEKTGHADMAEPTTERAAKAPPPEPKAPVAARNVPRDPAADAKPSIAERASPAHAARQASRRVRRPARETADLDERRTRRWDYPPPRRRWPEVADRAPRVGDVVPYDAPLYPPPPGYGRFYPRYPEDAGYPPPPGYGRRWWP